MEALKGLRYLFGTQLISRVFTFVLNILVIRKLSLGIAGLQLIMNTISLLTREAFRRVSLRESTTRDGALVTPKEMNFNWLVVPFGAVAVPILTFLFYAAANEEQLQEAYFSQTLLLTGIAMFLEMLSEPAYMLVVNSSLLHVRMYVESAGVLVRCVATFGLVSYTNLGLLSFGIAHVLYAAILVVGYFGYFVVYKSNIATTRDLFPRAEGARVDANIHNLLFTLKWQSLQKLILQEGEKFVLFGVSTLADQGIYAVVNNLGSLVARFLFQPLEEISSSVFSAYAKTRDDRPQNLQFFRMLTKLMIFICLYFVTFGPSYSYLLIQLLYGTKYSQTDAPMVLQVYCLYVCFMAINGITEAFVNSVARSDDLKYFNWLMILFSTVFVLASIVLVTRLQTAGLVLANCINMGMRIFFSLRFIRQYFSDLGQSIVDLPKPALLLHFLVAFITTNISSTQCSADSLFGCGVHFSLGALFFLTSSFHLYRTEWGSLAPLWAAIRRG